VRYYSFKQIDLKGKVPFVMLLVPIVVLVAVALDPPQMLYTVFFLYAFSAPVITLWQIRQIRRRPR